MIIELAKHIENLLQENDCVIVPGFGGFIAQYMPARRIEDENLFLPPYRTVGFNAQLVLNDGLLIQSYMLAHDVNYPEASLLVEDAVAELGEVLSKNGEVTIPNVGRLVLNVENVVTFFPNEEGLFSPSFYGLSSFEMLELAKETSEVVKPFIEKTSTNRPKHNTVIIRINRKWLNNAVAVAAAILLFFIMSTPVENTYVEPENYASLGDLHLFDQIRSKSVATSLVKMEAKTVVASTAKVKVGKEPVQKKEEPKQESNLSTHNSVESSASTPATSVVKSEVKVETSTPALKPIETEKKAETTVIKKEEPKTTLVKSMRYHIIVASVTNMDDAEKSIKFFADKGYPGATVIKGDGRVRIAISSFSDRKTADAKWEDLRKTELFQNAWILASRN